MGNSAEPLDRRPANPPIGFPRFGPQWKLDAPPWQRAEAQREA